VIYGCEGNLRSDLLTEILEHCTIKVFCIINYHLSRNTISANNVLLEKPFGGGGAYVRDRIRLNPLCELFNCHDSEGVIALC
jgi:hypothetical protein